MSQWQQKGLYIHEGGVWPHGRQGDKFKYHCSNPGIDDKGLHWGIYSREGVEVHLTNI